MKKFLSISFFLLTLLLLASCKEDPIPTYTVTFDSAGGSEVASQTINENEVATEPETDPTLTGFVFDYWYVDDENVAFDFLTPITADLTLVAKYTDQILMYISEDMDAVEANLYNADGTLNLPTSGSAHKSLIKWTTESPYISTSGIVLPLPKGEVQTTAYITARFILSGKAVSKDYPVELYPAGDVVISESRAVPFTNLTTEYTVADGTLDIYYEDGGSVPYVDVESFFNLLDGFIDNTTYDISFTYEGSTLTMFYQYYDETEDVTYDLECVIDAENDTITTNDPGFYWAYVYSTATNYGRHIEYDTDNADASYTEGSDVVYNLGDYGLDAVVYNNQVLVPYFLVNQLFAGSSYYNVYYNYDGLYGIYSLPSEGTKEYTTIHRSSVNGNDIPTDLLIHTYNVLAFDLDYFYGLKDINDIGSFYGFLNDYKDDLLTTDASDLDQAIADTLLKGIDEPHTSYGYPSYYNKTTDPAPSTGSLSDYGTRFTDWYYGLTYVDDAIEAKWGNSGTGWAANSTTRPHYWQLDATTVMLNLDDFYTADIEESATYDQLIAASILEVADASLVLPAVELGTKYFFYNSSTETNQFMEVLIEGLDASALTSYASLLTSFGYTYVVESTINADKVNGYYTYSVGDVDYMVQIAYDDDMDLFYLGIYDNQPDSFTATWPFYVDIFDTVYSDSAVYMEMMLYMISLEFPLVENMILDLTFNTGGNVGALYRVVGFITDQPFRVSGIDRDTGSESSSYVLIDGVPYNPNLNWSLLISSVTFSAANQMATIFMENDLGPIIGQQSGGGACSITPILLPNGTAFTMSSNNINAYRTGSGTEADPYVYHNNEYGIAPDFEIAINQLYTESVLLPIIHTYYSN